MIWNDDVLYIHVPKTGGMSLTEMLEAHLPGTVFSSSPEGHGSGSARVRHVHGLRHERLHEARRILARHGRNLDDFAAVIAVIRNPYDLEVSRFFHITTHFMDQKIHNTELIRKFGFEAFFDQSNFYGLNPPAIHQFYTDRRRTLTNMRLLRYEHLALDIERTVFPYLGGARPQLPHVNATRRIPWQDMMTEAVEVSIYDRFHWIFAQGLYPRYQPSRFPTRKEVEERIAALSRPDAGASAEANPQ
ncbi:sulfotransferase domain-containing protein [Paracoccus contaminans]|uniref:Sulfotransferase domain-containing protein n=1 Tax=Paracoccus contaminans TaxID=1945662 RepID=A0A1W6CWN0_9RHOB|nr:sulfotransferase domain-containing protein [Paracoccus contaminans]ARJ69261.1 hypothetical protein B0A89_06100 [Paracoccus contaminans]